MSAEATTRRVWRSAKGLALAALALAAIVVVVALSDFGRGSNDTGKQGSNAAEHLNSVELGMTQPQIRQIFGEPDSMRHSEADGERQDTWQYGTLNRTFVFKNGRLKAK